MKYVLITGASGGLGYALSEYLLKKNYYVIMLYHNNDRVKELNSKYNNSLVYQIDLTKDEEINRLKQYLKDNNISIDVLVNNAAIENTCEVEKKTKEDFLKIYELNTYVPFRLMESLDYKTCVNISSDDTFDMFDEVSMEYDLSKTALNLVSRIYMNRHKDRIYNTICFGWLDTPMNSYLDEDMKKDISFVPLDLACKEIESLFDKQETIKIIR